MTEVLETTPALAEALAAFHVAARTYRDAEKAFPGDDERVEALFEVKEAAELAVIRIPCETIDDVRAKAALALDDENVFDSCANCNFGGVHVLKILLRSFLGLDPETASQKGGTA